MQDLFIKYMNFLKRNTTNCFSSKALLREWKWKPQSGTLCFCVSGKELLSTIFRELQKFQKKKAENNSKMSESLEWVIHKRAYLNIYIIWKGNLFHWLSEDKWKLIFYNYSPIKMCKSLKTTQILSHHHL